MGDCGQPRVISYFFVSGGGGGGRMCDSNPTSSFRHPSYWLQLELNTADL